MRADTRPKQPREAGEGDAEGMCIAVDDTPQSALQRLAEGPDVYSERDAQAVAESTPYTLPAKAPVDRALSYPRSEAHLDEVEILLPAAKPPVTTPMTCCQELCGRLDWSFWLSIFSVACWAIAGNASRLALHNALMSVSFMSHYNMFGPNCVGSFAMGFFSGVVPEKYVPVASRALTVGFCGSFTTLSTWVYDVADNSVAGPAIEEVIFGVTMPFVFCVWGRDIAWRLDRTREACARRSNLAPPPVEEGVVRDEPSRPCWTLARRAYLGLDIVFLIVSVLAAVGIPLAMHFDRREEGSQNPVTQKDLYMVVLAPAGAVARYILSTLFNKYTALGGFPLGTLISNILGTVLLVVMENMMARQPGNEWYWLVANGIAGAFTTVSSFVNEAIELYAKRKVNMAYAYVLITCGLTIAIAAIARRETYKVQAE